MELGLKGWRPRWPRGLGVAYDGGLGEKVGSIGWVFWSPKIHVEILTPKAMALEGGDFGSD